MTLMGFTKTFLLGEVVQLVIRSIFAFVSISNTTDTTGWIFGAFLCFSIAEPIRYPFYLLKILNLSETTVGHFFGHLRYNMFLICYPFGAFCDQMTAVTSKDPLEKSGDYSYKMPNSMNISFDFAFMASRFIPMFCIFALPVNYMQVLAGRKKFYSDMKTTKID